MSAWKGGAAVLLAPVAYVAFCYGMAKLAGDPPPDSAQIRLEVQNCMQDEVIEMPVPPTQDQLVAIAAICRKIVASSPYP